MKQVVMVDVDDTLADSQTPILAYVNSRSRRHYRYHDLSRDFRESTTSEYGRLVQSYLKEAGLIADHQPYPGCLEAVRHLHEAGYAVHIVSSRKENLHSVTRDWLERHGFMPYLTEIHGRPSASRGYEFKETVAQAIGAAAAFDDTYDVALALAEAGVTAYLIDRPWNHDEAVVPGMRRCASFPAAVEAFLAQS